MQQIYRLIYSIDTKFAINHDFCTRNQFVYSNDNCSSIVPVYCASILCQYKPTIVQLNRISFTFYYFVDSFNEFKNKYS